jgi:hypothetical protein
MLISADQIKKIYALLQEYPSATLIKIRSEINGSGIGTSDFADFIEDQFLRDQKLLGSVEITDYRMW